MTEIGFKFCSGRIAWLTMVGAVFSFVCYQVLGGSRAAFRLVLASSSKVPLMSATSPATTATSETQTEDIVGVWRRLKDILDDFKRGPGSETTTTTARPLPIAPLAMPPERPQAGNARKRTYACTFQQHTQTQNVLENIEQLRPDTYDERSWADDIRVTRANRQPWNGFDILHESHFPLHTDVPRTLPIAPVAMPP